MKNGYHLSPLTAGDKPSLIRYLNEREIYLRTLSIPFPYTEADSDSWIDHLTQREKKKGGRTTTFAIRTPEGEMIGCIGLDGLVIGKQHRAELGYWLAKPYWNSGLMTSAVADVVTMGFDEFGLQKITATVFTSNAPSQRVLEKNGFIVEGELKRHYMKDGKLLDVRVLARFPDSVP